MQKTSKILDANFFKIILLCCICLLATKSYGKVPSLGNSYLLSEQEEFELGQAWVRGFKAGAPLKYDALIQNYLENLINNLIVFEKNLAIKQTQVLLINDASFNAFAVPGGIIGVNLGIFTYLPNEAELASVLAHEIGHISQHHFVRRLEGSKNLFARQIFGIITAMILGGVTANPNVTSAGIMASQGAMIQSALAYSRTQEQEADRVGLQILTAAGYPATSMAMAFTRMQHQIMLNGANPPQFLLTHPLSETRIADINSRIDAKTSYTSDKKATSKSYNLIRIRSMFLNFGDKNHIISLLQSENSAKYALDYARALLEKSNKNYPSAIALLQKLIQQDKHNLILNASLAEILHLNKQDKVAIKILTKILEINHDYYPALYLLASVQKNSDKITANGIFNKLALMRPNDQDVWLEFYESSKKNKDLLNTYRAKAEYSQLLGDFNTAISQLKLAKSISKNYDFPTQARILQRLEDMQIMANRYSLK